MYIDGRAVVANRWFGAPCEDIKEDLGPCVFTPFTIEKAREVAQMIGYTPLFDNDYDEAMSDSYVTVIAIKPTRDGAEDAWLEFWKE